jgi:predicted chitinase
MLTDGEFVMSRGAVQKYGVDTLEGMNAAGGGTNQPKIVSGTTYAKGGGMIGDKMNSKELKAEKNVSSPKEDLSKSSMKEPTVKPSPKSTTPKSTTPKSTLPNLSQIELKFASRAKQRGITDPIELKAFLSQVKHESGGNFGEPQREKYNSSPNDPPGKPGYEYFKGYANPALGLGNRNADDAYNYIGRGYLQVTGRANYDDIGKRIGKDLVGNPKLLMNKDIALDASIEYWKRSVRPNVKNWNNTFEVSRAVNKPSAVSPDEITGMTDREDAFQGYSAIPNKTFANLKTDVAAKPKPSIKNQPNMFQKFGSAISSIMSPPALAEQPSASSKLNPAQTQTQNNVPKINPPSKSKVKVVYATSPGGIPKLNTSSGASPSVPSFSVVHPNSESRRQILAILGVK